MAVLGLRFCARAFSSCGKRGPLLIAVRGPLTVAASPVAEHRLQTRTLSSCGSRAQPLRGMWDPPGPGHEPVSPALAGGLPTTAPPGKPLYVFLNRVTCMLFEGMGGTSPWFTTVTWHLAQYFYMIGDQNKYFINKCTFDKINFHMLFE